jgi:hypothetical protein
MLQQIKELLTSKKLQDSMRGAASRDDAAKLLVEAGAHKGYRLTIDGVTRALAELSPVRSRSLSEDELLLVSGGLANSANRLCHTESCGGNHAGCC